MDQINNAGQDDNLQSPDKTIPMLCIQQVTDFVQLYTPIGTTTQLQMKSQSVYNKNIILCISTETETIGKSA